VYGIGDGGRHGALLVGLVGGLLERLAHGARRVFGGLPGLLRPLGVFPGVPGALQCPAQRGGLGEHGHGCGVGVAGRLPVQFGELR